MESFWDLDNSCSCFLSSWSSITRPSFNHTSANFENKMKFLCVPAAGPIARIILKNYSKHWIILYSLCWWFVWLVPILNSKGKFIYFYFMKDILNDWFGLKNNLWRCTSCTTPAPSCSSSGRYWYSFHCTLQYCTICILSWIVQCTQCWIEKLCIETIWMKLFN